MVSGYLNTEFFVVRFHHYVSKISVLFSTSAYVVTQSVYKVQMNSTNVFHVLVMCKALELTTSDMTNPDLALGLKKVTI